MPADMVNLTGQSQISLNEFFFWLKISGVIPPGPLPTVERVESSAWPIPCWFLSLFAVMAGVSDGCKFHGVHVLRRHMKSYPDTKSTEWPLMQNNDDSSWQCLAVEIISKPHYCV